MADKSISLGKGYQGGTQVTIYADSYDEFLQILTPIYGEVTAKSLLQGAFSDLANSYGPEPAALNNLNQSIGIASEVTPPVSTVGQPLPQPGVTPAVTVTQPGPVVPPGLEYPGDCQHGVRKYNDKPARGRAWRRWECALPWKPGNENKAYNAGRCESINVD